MEDYHLNGLKVSKVTNIFLLIKGDVWMKQQSETLLVCFTEKKKSQSWFQRQFTRQGSQDYDANNVIEYATAVAAVAFAINNLEEQPETSLTSIKSNKEDTRSLAQEPGRASQRFSGKDVEHENCQ
jgi:hypothetical protein